MNFEWNLEKNAENARKHGITLASAARVFQDENRLEYYDEKHSYNEDRYYTIGLVEDIIYVVYTERNNNIRLISARAATAKERKLYYDSIYKR